jgi:hypothetical protein
VQGIDKFRISPNAVARRVGDETVILHLGSGTYFGLEGVGARAWQLLGEEKSLNEICDVLLDEYEVARQDLKRDVETLIKHLLEQDLINVAS